MTCCDPSVDIIYNLNSYYWWLQYCCPPLPAPPWARYITPAPPSLGIWRQFFTKLAKLKQENIVMILISICYHLVVMRPRDAEITMEIFFQSWFNCHNNQNHKNNIMEPDPFKARQFPEFLYPLPPALSPLPGPETAGHLIPGSRWHLSPLSVGGRWRCQMTLAASGWKLVGL